VLLVGRSRDRFPMVSLGIVSVVPPTEPCALRWTQPLKMSTRDISWGKGGRCIWLTIYYPCSAERSTKSRALIYPELLGPLRPVAEDLYLYIYNIYIYRVSQEECARLREGVPYVKVYRYNPKHLCPKLNGNGDNGHRKVCSSGGSTTVPVS